MAKREVIKIDLIIVSLILFIIAYFFLKSKLDLSWTQSLAISAILLILLIYFQSKNYYQYLIFAFSQITIFISLVITFTNPNTGDSPLAINIILNPWVLFLFSTLISFALVLGYARMKEKDPYEHILLILFIIVWFILAINPLYFEDWALENVLAIPFVLLLVYLNKKFEFSNISYSLIFIFLFLHTIGSHYTYSQVPLGFWLQDWFDLTRNHYDRIVHCCFGLLLAYPIRELSIRVGNFKGFWSFYFPIDLVFAFSAIFEIIEGLLVILFGGDLGVAYLGMQGDVWDAQKDMALAGFGSIVAMTITFLINFYYRGEKLIKEIDKSITVKYKRKLGEETIKNLKKLKKL